MKKLLFTIFIFLLTAIAATASNAQIFNNNETGTGKNSEIHSSVKENSEERIDTEKFFRAGNDDYTRPNVGDGIGEMPIGDELFILMLCSMLFGAIKLFKRKRNQIDVKDNLEN